jgi:hypothetical protein
MVVDHLNGGTETLLEPGLMVEVKKVLDEFKPEMLVELGTYCGGFTKYLCEWFPNVPIFTIDLVSMVSRTDMDLFREKGNVSVIITNQLFENGDLLPMLLSSPRRKFFFCDNGSKIEEVREFAGYLRPGDLLAVHDWSVEIHWEEIANVMGQFEDHPFNAKFPLPSDTWIRMWTKKQVTGKQLILKRYHENKSGVIDA